MSDAAAKRRARQTVNNLALSLLATIGIVVALVLIVPRDNSNHIPKVDATSIAASASQSSGLKILVPDLPQNWWSNSARWLPESIDAVPTFKAGFIGPNNEYIGETMGFGANPTWLALKLQGALLSGKFASKWDIYQSQKVHDPAETMDYVMVRAVGKDYILLYGTAKPTDFETLAASLDSKLQEVRPNE